MTSRARREARPGDPGGRHKHQTELLDRSVWRTHDEARSAVFGYIEIFYNRARLNSALGYLSPDRFERRYRFSTTTAA